jgi:hypothetical protein
MHQNYSLAFNSRRKNSKGKKLAYPAYPTILERAAQHFCELRWRLCIPVFVRVVLGSTLIKQPFLLDRMCANGLFL